MEIIKKIAVSILVLVISAAVFFMLIKEQNVKKDILRTTLELFGRELLAMVPDNNPQKNAIAQAMNAFIDQAEQNNLPEEQIQKTVALGLNMSMSPRQLSPEELQAVFDIHADSAEIRMMKENRKGHPPTDRERLAHEINTMITFRRELTDMERDSSLDSLRARFANRVVFAADSGLKILIPTEFHGDRPLPPEWRDRLEKLERDKMVITYDFRHLAADIQKQRLEGAPLPPPIPLEAYAEIIMELKRNHINLDSLNWPTYLSNPDSLKAFLARIQKSTHVRFQLN